MKQLFSFLIICLSVLPGFSQTFQWAQKMGLYAFDYAYGVGTDANGNVYVAGKYEMNAYFGGVYVGCAGNHDIFVAKYSPSGQFLWVRTAGGNWGDYSHCLIADAAGNVYTAGEIETTVTFHNGTKLTSNGGNDIFLAKYTTNGDLAWARKVGGGSLSDKGLAITEFNGSVYVTGYFQGSNARIGNGVFSSKGGRDIFIAKYNSSGTCEWTKAIGGTGDDEGDGITHDIQGNVYLTGYFSKSVNFGAGTITSRGGTDIFLTKYNPQGGIIWSKRAGGGANDYGYAVACDKQNHISVTGGFRLTSDFGAFSAKANGGNADVFIVSYDVNGNCLWLRKAGGNLNDYGRGIATDSYSNVYITGNYGNKAIFGSKTVTAADSSDIFIASYSGKGDFRWIKTVTGEYDAPDYGRPPEMGLAICVDKNSNVIVSGDYRSKSVFDKTVLSPFKHTDGFVAKITQSSAARLEEDSLKNEIDDSLLINLYPNPNTGSFTLEINISEQYEGNWNIRVINEVGQEVYSTSIQSSNTYLKETLELEKSLPSGLYFVEVTAGELKKTLRVMIRRE